MLWEAVTCFMLAAVVSFELPCRLLEPATVLEVKQFCTFNLQ